MQDKIPVERDTIPVKVSSQDAREKRLLEFEALADFANLSDTTEDWEKFRGKWPEFFPQYLTDWIYESAKRWKRLSSLPEAQPDDYLMLLREFSKDPDAPIPPDAWPEIARYFRSEVRELRPLLILFRIFLRVVWKRKDREGRCLKTLLGFDTDWPYGEFEEETNEEFTTVFELPGRPKTEEEIEEEEARKVVAQFNRRFNEPGQKIHMEIQTERRVAFGGLRKGSPVVDGDTGIITWKFGCQFQGAVYDLMQDRWRAMVCPECGKCFVADRTAQKYCSPECWGRRKKEQALAYYNLKGKRARQKAKSLRAKSHGRKS